jgi:small subunit ribosomal protein S4
LSSSGRGSARLSGDGHRKYQLAVKFLQKNFMSRYRGPRLRITRRLGELPGLVRKSSAKKNPPGQHGALPQKPSQYSLRLKEKQKLRFHYGVNEKQLVSYVKKARQSKGATGEKVLQLLEMRLDSILFRSGLAPTLRASRQLVSHGHIALKKQPSATQASGTAKETKPQKDLQPVNIPSYQCKPGDIFVVKNKKASRQLVQSQFDSSGKANTIVPTYLQFDPKNFTGEIKQMISRTEVSCPVNEFLIIEYYSRKV